MPRIRVIKKWPKYGQKFTKIPKIQPHDDETENKYASSFKEFEWN